MEDNELSQTEKKKQKKNTLYLIRNVGSGNHPKTC